MSITPRQERLYNAVTAIDDTHLEEALSSRPRTSMILKRLAAVAAVVAIFIGCIFFWPASNSEPIFSVTVNAADVLDTTITITAHQVPEYEPNTGHIKDSLSENWKNLDLFCIQIEMDGVSEDYLASSHVVIEYQGQTHAASANTDHLSILIPDSNTDSNLCQIYGWAEDVSVAKLNFTLRIYHDETLLYDQPIEIYYHNGRLGINGKFGNHTNAVSWSSNLMSTAELVAMIAEDIEPPKYYLLSDTTEYNIHRVTRNHYRDILSVLDTRSDVGRAIIEQLILLEQPNNNKEIDVNRDNRIIALRSLLETDFYDQLSDEDIGLYELYLTQQHNPYQQ